MAYRTKKVTSEFPYGTQVRTPKDAAAVVMQLETAPGVTLADEACEVAVVLTVNTKHRILGYHVMSRGSLDAAPMHPREVFKAALLSNAAAIIVAHNHPSGDPMPSRDDRLLTARLHECGELLGVDVLDSVIVAGSRYYYSFRENGSYVV